MLFFLIGCGIVYQECDFTETSSASHFTLKGLYFGCTSSACRRFRITVSPSLLSSTGRRAGSSAFVLKLFSSVSAISSWSAALLRRSLRHSTTAILTCEYRCCEIEKSAGVVCLLSQRSIKIFRTILRASSDECNFFRE